MKSAVKILILTISSFTFVSADSLLGFTSMKLYELYSHIVCFGIFKFFYAIIFQMRRKFASMEGFAELTQIAS